MVFLKKGEYMNPAKIKNGYKKIKHDKVVQEKFEDIVESVKSELGVDMTQQDIEDLEYVKEKLLDAVNIPEEYLEREVESVQSAPVETQEESLDLAIPEDEIAEEPVVKEEKKPKGRPGKKKSNKK
jgi:hypothetical protein